MGYRKFKADHLFTGFGLADPDAVLVTTENGTVRAVIPSAEAGEDIEYHPGILSPGFINCHCHLELSHMKGSIPEKTGLIDFLLSVMRQRNTDPAAAARLKQAQPDEWILSAITTAEQTMTDYGIAAVGDVCNTTHTLRQKEEGNLHYHNFIETAGFLEDQAAGRFENSLNLFRTFTQAPRLPAGTHSVVPHAPYSVSSRLFGLIAHFEPNKLLTIHNQESEAENRFSVTGQGDFLRLYRAMGVDTSFFQGTGKRSLESFLPHFHRDQRLILVHNVATREEDLQFALKWQKEEAGFLREANARSSNLFFCLCPLANVYIGGLLPDLDLLIRSKVQVVIGTDSLASNHQLSILEEIKVLQRRFPQTTTASLLQWATANGARALQLDSVLGSFTAGKQPGVLLIDHLAEGKLTERSSVKRLAPAQRPF
jgi:aminodeoxyfutalosine deaminase